MTFRELRNRIIDMTQAELSQTVYVKHPETGCMMQVDVAWTDDDIMNDDGDEIIVYENDVYLEI